MKCINILLSLLLLVTVDINAEKNNSTNDDLNLYKSALPKTKSSDKRWLQGDIISNSALPTQNEKSHAKFNYHDNLEERAKEEKTLQDFIPRGIIQNTLINALKPQPLLDTASEKEKTATSPGNGADVIGDFIVKGSETFSRAINAIMAVPKQAFKQLSAGATQALNQIGAFIVGL